MHILVTGGAGFIGSHLVDALLAKGHAVRVYDSLEPQVHGPDCARPAYLHPDAELVRGDVRDRDGLRAALEGQDAVYHFASAVGVGQSMYDIRRYVEINSVGTATLLEVIAQERRDVQRLVLASSMSNYGEGACDCPRCGEVFPRLRPAAQLAARDWDLHCPTCGSVVTPRATSEDKPLFPTSVYATTKRDQEEMFYQVGLAYGIPTTVFRFFNVYGTRQALSNPYTGVVAIFANCFLAGEPPIMFEDGEQARDFISVHDIVAANVAALERGRPGVDVLNLGTGRPTSLAALTRMLAEQLGVPPDLVPVPCNRFRAGDVRACFADISRAEQALGYRPGVSIEQGMGELVQWLRSQRGARVTRGALAELEQRGLVT
jgi:dTDP-L-rhamnose 4-epimerase